MSACAMFAAVLVAAAPAAPAADAPVVPRDPAPAVAPRPDLRPRLVVEGATQLPRLMQGDPAFHEQALALEHRQTLSWVAGGLGIAAFLGFSFASVGSMGSGDPSSGQPPEGAMYALAGVASLAVGGLVAVLVHPRRGEVVDLVNGWNLAHPDRPLEVQPVLVVPAVPLD